MTEYTKLKSYYGRDLAKLLADKIYNIFPKFQKQKFIERVDKDTKNLELKARVEVITDSLYEFLPKDYKESVNIMMNILGPPNQNETGMFRDGYWLMPIAFFVEKYGIDDFETSTNAIYQITQRSTGEYAVRPFLIRFPDRMISLMLEWSQSKNVHVRRLSSEGIRPRLPWARKLDQFIRDPKPILPILENLRQDESLFVKKSVANNLNDILKDNYSIGFKVLKKWSNSQNTNTQWIIKHALRNELKKGNVEAKRLILYN
ncbi:DNA alkylation repair protein [Candidatus Nitrosocosmicus sp. T]